MVSWYRHCFTDRTVKVWDLNTGEETLSCAGHKRDVVAVRYCHKTQRIFGASQNVIKVKTEYLPSASLVASA